MKIIITILIVLSFLFSSGCFSLKEIELIVIDSKTNEKVEEVFVFVSQGDMFNPFNNDYLYVTNEEGKTNIKGVGTLLFIYGKTGYPPQIKGVYATSKDEKFLLQLKTELQKPMLKKIKIRNGFLKNYNTNKNTKDFLDYLLKNNIEIYNFSTNDKFTLPLKPEAFKSLLKY